MSDPFIPNEGKLANLNDINSAGTPFTAHLMLQPCGVTALTVAGDMTEAGYAGYASQTAVYAAAALDGAGRPCLTAAPLTFTSTGTSTPGSQNVIGWYVTDTGGKLAGGITYFPIVIDFAVNGATVTFTPTIPGGDLC